MGETGRPGRQPKWVTHPMDLHRLQQRAGWLQPRGKSAQQREEALHRPEPRAPVNLKADAQESRGDEHIQTNQPRGPFCQSCAIPMSESSSFGTNADGSRNGDYCHYCYQQGAFVEPGVTADHMVSKCEAIMKSKNMRQGDIDHVRQLIPTLKRWAKS